MKKKILYLVTTTTDDRWEMAQGNFLIITESPETAGKLIKEKTNQRVIAVVDVKETMKNGEVLTVNQTVVE